MSTVNVDLTDRVALVTGAGRGIGRAIATGLAECGAHVVLASRSSDQLETLAQEITSAGGKATPITTDLADEQSICETFSNVQSQLGQLDVLINNAGVGIYGPVQEFSAEDFDRIISVNLRGTFLCCREAMKLMTPAKAGYIINISSVVGFKGYIDQAAYTASKHGVMGLTKSLSLEAQPAGVRVSAILPGGVDTDMVAQARPDLDRSILIQPTDITRTVLFLLGLSDHCAIDQIYIRRKNSTPF